MKSKTNYWKANKLTTYETKTIYCEAKNLLQQNLPWSTSVANCSQSSPGEEWTFNWFNIHICSSWGVKMVTSVFCWIVGLHIVWFNVEQTFSCTVLHSCTWKVECVALLQRRKCLWFLGKKSMQWWWWWACSVIT